MAENISNTGDNTNQEEECLRISAPDPLPESQSSPIETYAEDDIEKKLKTNRIPKPSPKSPDATVAKTDVPISDETISLKRSQIKEAMAAPAEIAEERKIKIACYHCEQKLDLSDMQAFTEVECPSCKVKLIVPKWFNNYLLEEPGGEGGMALVYRGLDLTLDREVAIKVLNEKISTNEERSQLFLHEARTAATINHYAVIPIYTCGVFEKQPYIVMQYMEGGALDTKIEKEKKGLPINHVLKWIKDVADGLDNARRHGIIHHDVKPANILLDKDNNAKIGDFGIAQAIYDFRSEEINKLTRTWASPQYVSPEKALSGKEDHCGDIYSLGISFFQLLTGELPFDNPDINVMVKMRLETEAPDPTSLRPEIPAKISKLILAMVDKSPGKRPSYREIIAGIEEQLRLWKTSKRGASQVSDSSKRQKSESKKIVIEDKKPRIVPEKNKSLVLQILIHMIISIVVFLSLFIAWKLGYLDTIIRKIRGERTIESPELAPDITSLLRVGQPEQAAEKASEILDNSNSSSAKRKQAAIQLAMCYYLQNLPDAKNRCASILDKLASLNLPEDDASVLILNVLSKDNISAERHLKDNFADNIFDRTIAGYCLYIRAIYDKKRDLETESLARRCASSSAAEDFWGNALKPRLKIWKDWMEYGDGDGNLEPLILANKFDKNLLNADQVANDKTPPPAREKAPDTAQPSTPSSSEKKQPSSSFIVSAKDEKTIATLDISSLTAEFLKKDRESFAAGRIKPPNYDFDFTLQEKHLASLDTARKETETTRLTIVANMKHYLCSLTARNNYNQSFKTSNGKVMSGSMMANPNFLSVKAGKNYNRIKWNELPPQELAKMIAYYANMRMKISRAGESPTDAATRKNEAAEDYLRLAILCDWYGCYDDTVVYAQKSMEINPDMTARVKKYIMK